MNPPETDFRASRTHDGPPDSRRIGDGGSPGQLLGSASVRTMDIAPATDGQPKKGIMMNDQTRLPLAALLSCVLLCGCTGVNGGDGNNNGNGACASSSACDDGDPCTTDTCADGSCVNAPIDNCTSSTAVRAFVTYTFEDAVYRVEVAPGASSENVSDLLNALEPGQDDNSLNISPDGQWLVLNSERFDNECDGYACLTISPFDLSSAEVVRAGGDVVHVDAPGVDPFSAVGSGGDLIVFPGADGPNTADLFAVSRDGSSWSAPVLLTADSAYAYNSQPAISGDGSRVVFDCGDGQYHAPPAAICEVGTDGAGFRVVRTTEGQPQWDAVGCSLHHPDYGANGSIVAEPACQIWRVETVGGGPEVVTTQFANDNSPCVLPDGRIASLWLDRPGGPGFHEIKIMDPDGSNSFVLVENIDVLDIGIGCGGSVVDNGGGGSSGGSASGAAARFPQSSIWYEDISSAPLDDQSDAVIEWLADNGGWGTGEMRIDFSIEVLAADGDTPVRSFVATDDHFLPDCDLDRVPVPVGGALEGEDGYECESDGDCHLIVVDDSANLLYEMWRANIPDREFFGGCLSVWDLSRDYGGAGRGANCTSADAAGFPIAPLLFSADEVQSGEIDHAIRFILPNERIRERVYVGPATHSTGATSGGSNAPPYGARFRLRADYPIDTLPSEGARVVARAMQRYGMFLADAGNIALTALSDRFTNAKWDGLLDTRDLDTLQVSDFEMVEGGPRYDFAGDCIRLD